MAEQELMAWLLFITLMSVVFEVPYLNELNFQKIKVCHSREITKKSSAHEAGDFFVCDS